MNYEDLLFTALSPLVKEKPEVQKPSFNESDDEIVRRIQEGTRLATFDYRVYDEIKQMKKEIRQARAMNNLVNLLTVREDAEEEKDNKDGIEEEEDEFSMSISYDYGERDYEYGADPGDPFAD